MSGRISMALLLLPLGLLLGAEPVQCGEVEEWAAGLPDWKFYTWQDIGLIMTRAEEEQFQSLDSRHKMDAWVAAFWLQRDPTPTTEHNERREEHLKRLETARALYIADDVYGLDLRGRDYVFFGPPDEKVPSGSWFDETGFHPARDTWIWVGQEMRATYSDWNLDGAWEQAWDEVPSTRPDVQRRLENAYLNSGMKTDPISGENEDTEVLESLRLTNPDKYMELVQMLNEGELINPIEIDAQAMVAELMGPTFRRLEGNYFRARREHRDPYRHDFQVDALWSVFAVDCFQGGRGRIRVDLSHQVRLHDLDFDWNFDEQVFKAELLRRVVFYDGNNETAASSEDRLPISAETLEDTRTALLVPGLSAQELSPGLYRMALRLEDVGSGKLQIYQTSVEVPAFPPDSLTLSDITFASSISASKTPGIFSKGDWTIQPHPIHLYTSQRDLNIYFEIYGLATDALGLNEYTVTYRIRREHQREQSGWLWTKEDVVSGEVSSTFADRHGGQIARHPLSIGTKGFAEDSYLLEIEVRDLIAERSVRGRGRFSIMPETALH